MCEDAKKDQNFQGKCLDNKEPTSEEYEDFYEQNKSNTMRTKDNKTVLFSIFSMNQPCPSGYKRGQRGKCQKVISNIIPVLKNIFKIFFSAFQHLISDNA